MHCCPGIRRSKTTFRKLLTACDPEEEKNQTKVSLITSLFMYNQDHNTIAIHKHVHFKMLIIDIIIVYIIELHGVIRREWEYCDFIRMLLQEKQWSVVFSLTLQLIHPSDQSADQLYARSYAQAYTSVTRCNAPYLNDSKLEHIVSLSGLAHTHIYLMVHT